MDLSKLDFSLFGHKFDVSEVLKDVIPFLIAFAGITGINVEAYKSIFNELVTQFHTDLGVIHGLGWGGLILAIVQVFMRNRVSTQTTTVAK